MFKWSELPYVTNSQTKAIQALLDNNTFVRFTHKDATTGTITLYADAKRIQISTHGKVTESVTECSISSYFRQLFEANMLYNIEDNPATDVIWLVRQPTKSELDNIHLAYLQIHRYLAQHPAVDIFSLYPEETTTGLL